MRFGIFHKNRLHSQDPMSHSMISPPVRGDIQPLLADLLTDASRVRDIAGSRRSAR